MKAVEVYAKGMTEAELSERIRLACKYLGFLAFHTHNSKRSAPGYPDWHIVGPSGSLFRELKTEKGRLSVDQVLWLEALTRIGHDAEVWRPTCWLSGRIMRELQQLAQRSPDGPGGTGVTPSGATRAKEAAVLDSDAGTDRAASADGPGAVGGGAL